MSKNPFEKPKHPIVNANFTRVEAVADVEMMARAMKYAVIEQFNEAVEKRASKTFLTSLYKQAKFDLAEYNRALKLLPGDGLDELNMEWED